LSRISYGTGRKIGEEYREKTKLAAYKIFLREEEENNLPQMKPLFFLYVWLNLTRIAGLRKENLVKEIK